MLQIKNVTFIHKKDLRVLIEELSLSLRAGDKIAVIGEEGNGKSTLLRWIAQPLAVENYMEVQGTIIKNGLRIGYLPQEMEKEVRGQTVYEFFSNEEAFWEKTPSELAQTAKELGLTIAFFYSDQSVAKLSGGEQVKLQLAQILLQGADLFLLDEPSNDLDLEALEWLEGFIQGRNEPILFISHDETLLERTANGILHIEQLRRKTKPRHSFARMDYRSYVEERLYGMEKQEQIAKDERRSFAKQQEKFRQIQQKVEHEQSTISRQDPHGGQLLKKKMKAVKSMEKRFMREQGEFAELPETEDAIFVRFDEKIGVPSGKRILEYQKDILQVADKVLARDIALQVYGKEKICIIGRNGRGKTTLLREIAEELLQRQDIRCFYMPQNYEEVLPMDAIPVEYVASDSSVAQLQQARTYLGCMRYTVDEMEHEIGALSGGQKAKLLLLKMIHEGCDVLILDEPTRNFSPLSAPVIRQILREFGGCIISVSHDRKFMEEVADKVYRLEEDGLWEMRE